MLGWLLQVKYNEGDDHCRTVPPLNQGRPCPVTYADMNHWYAIHTKARQEALAAEHLCRQTFEVYLPSIKQVHRYRGQWRDSIEPLFPRYLFIRLNLGEENIAPIRSTRGVARLVSFSGRPAMVPGTFIDALTRASDPHTGLLYPEKDLFEAGATVTIMDGPLHGLEAIFKVHDGEQRSIILLNILGKTQQVSIDRDHLVSAQHNQGIRKART